MSHPEIGVQVLDGEAFVSTAKSGTRIVVGDIFRTKDRRRSRVFKIVNIEDNTGRAWTRDAFRRDDGTWETESGGGQYVKLSRLLPYRYELVGGPRVIAPEQTNAETIQ